MFFVFLVAFLEELQDFGTETNKVERLGEYGLNRDFFGKTVIGLYTVFRSEVIFQGVRRDNGFRLSLL